MRIIAILAILVLAACSSPTYEDYAATCRSYGFTPGNTAFSQCIQTESQGYHSRLMMGLNAAKPMPGW